MTRPDVPGPEFTFFRIPLCDMKPIISPTTFESTVQRCANVVKWEQFSTSTCSVIGDIYHFAQLTSLVGPTTYLPEGKGILKDEGLRYGRCSHRYNMGSTSIAPSSIACSTSSTSPSRWRPSMLLA